MNIAPVVVTVVLCLIYVALIFILTALTRNWWIWVVLIYSLVVLFAGAIAGAIILGEHFMAILVFPLLPIDVLITAIQHRRLRNYLKRFKQNKPAEAVLFLGHPKWSKFEAWVKPNFYKGEVKSIVGYLNEKGQDFSFYPTADFDEVEKIMADRSVKEVYFLGHGNSHAFKLSDDCDIYYCDFNDPKYGKELVHQVHCGTKHGKSLYEYVVPKENWGDCFLIRKLITSCQIKREFRKKTADIKKQKQTLRN